MVLPPGGRRVGEWRDQSSGDGGLIYYNAVIILDAFAKMVPWSINQGLPDKDLPSNE